MPGLPDDGEQGGRLVEILVDTRDLPAPEPFAAVMAALPRVGPGDFVLMRHRFEPGPLYGTLAGLGFERRTRVVGEGDVRVVIWRRGDAASAGAADAALARNDAP